MASSVAGVIEPALQTDRDPPLLAGRPTDDLAAYDLYLLRGYTPQYRFLAACYAHLGRLDDADRRRSRIMWDRRATVELPDLARPRALLLLPTVVGLAVCALSHLRFGSAIAVERGMGRRTSAAGLSSRRPS